MDLGGVLRSRAADGRHREVAAPFRISYETVNGSGFLQYIQDALLAELVVVFSLRRS